MSDLERGLHLGDGGIRNKEGAVVHRKQICLEGLFVNENLEEYDADGGFWGTTCGQGRTSRGIQGVQQGGSEGEPALDKAT